MPLYNLVAWLVPLAIVLPMLLLGKLGYNPNIIIMVMFCENW